MNAFLFNNNANPSFLVFLRCATGIILGISFLAVSQDFGQLYGRNGLVDPELLMIKQGRQFITIYDIQEYIQQHYPYSEQQIHQILFVLFTSLCAFLTIGLFTRISSLLLLLLHNSLFIAVAPFSYGFDYFCTIALFYCFVFPTGHYKSLDQKLFKLKPSKWVAQSLRVLQIHVSLVYFFSGFDKLLGHTWRNGDAIWKTMHLPYSKSVLMEEMNILGAYPWIWAAAGWLIILIELFYPIFIWIPQTRRIQLGLILTLHLQIALFLDLYLFSAIMIALNISAFSGNTSISQKTLETPLVSSTKAKEMHLSNPSLTSSPRKPT